MLQNKVLQSVLIVLLAAGLMACGEKKTAGNGGANGGVNTDSPGQGGTPAKGETQNQAPAFEGYELDSAKLKTTDSGMMYQIVEEGDGQVPQKGQTVIANYHGTLPSGDVFDSSFERGQPFQFPLGQGRVIKGWDEAFAMFPVGTKAILILPPDLAYGERGAPPNIPPNATLRFDVELLGIGQAQQGGQPMGRR